MLSDPDLPLEEMSTTALYPLFALPYTRSFKKFQNSLDITFVRQKVPN